MELRQLGLICLAVLLCQCSTTPREELAFPRGWIPLAHEERAIDWEKMERMEGLSLVSNHQPPSPLNLPFNPLLPQFTALLLDNGDGSFACPQTSTDLTFSYRIERRIPSHWNSAKYLLEWLLVECEKPQAIESVPPWIAQAEEHIAQAASPELRRWARQRWVDIVERSDIFWDSSIVISDLVLDAVAANFDQETARLDSETKALWLLWWSHVVHLRGEIQKARFIRESVLLQHPSERVTHFMRRRYPNEYPFATSLLPAQTRLKFADALLQHGDIDQSLTISRSLFKTEKGPFQIQAGKIIEQIHRARGEPELYYQWKLKNQQLEAKDKQPKQKRSTHEIIPDPIASPDGFYSYVRTLWNANQSSKALRHISEALSQTPTQLSSAQAARLNYLQAQILLERGETKSALSLLNELKPSLKDKEFYWNLATANIFANEFQSAREILDRFVNQETDPLARSKALFWKAYSERQLQMETHHVETLFQLFNEDPISFYSEMGLIQVQALKKGTDSEPTPSLFIDSPESHFRVQTQSTKLSVRETQEFFFLLYLPDRDLSRIWLKRLPEKTVPPEWQAASGLHILSIPKLVEWRRNQKRLPNYFHRMYFPREFWDIITDVSRRYDVDPFLILALIRQESIFQERATSAAKAMGAMQLLPGTAQETHRLLPSHSPLKRERFYPERLYDPRWSIELGTSYFSRLLKKYRGNWIATIGAYNGGPGAMGNWIKTRHHPNPLLFIERIPYQETRFYIQLVLRNYLFYKRIYEGQTPQIVLESPGNQNS